MKKHVRHYSGFILILVFAVLTTSYTTLKITDHEPFSKSSTLTTYDGKVCTFSKTGYPFTVFTSVSEEPCTYSSIPPQNTIGIKYGVNSYFNLYGLLGNFIASGITFGAFYSLVRKFSK